MKVLIHPVKPLKFGNGKAISSHIYEEYNNSSMQGLKLTHIDKRGDAINEMNLSRTSV